LIFKGSSIIFIPLFLCLVKFIYMQRKIFSNFLARHQHVKVVEIFIHFIAFLKFLIIVNTKKEYYKNYFSTNILSNNSENLIFVYLFDNKYERNKAISCGNGGKI